MWQSLGVGLVCVAILRGVGLVCVAILRGVGLVCVVILRGWDWFVWQSLGGGTGLCGNP